MKLALLCDQRSIGNYMQMSNLWFQVPRACQNKYSISIFEGNARHQQLVFSVECIGICYYVVCTHCDQCQGVNVELNSFFVAHLAAKTIYLMLNIYEDKSETKRQKYPFDNGIYEKYWKVAYGLHFSSIIYMHVQCTSLRSYEKREISMRNRRSIVVTEVQSKAIY